MRKFILSLFTVCMLIAILNGCGSSETISKTTIEKPVEVPKHQLYLDVEFESNLLFDIYDVDVYIDDEKVGNILHGKNFTLLLEVDEGSHLVKFENEGDSTVTAEKKIEVKNEMTFKCTIKGHGDEIEFVDIELLDSIQGNSIRTDNYLGRALESVLKELETSGFINVEYKSIDESDSIWDPANWVIIEQNIDPGVELDKNTEIILSCEKIEKYLDDNYLDLNLAEAVNKATGLKHVLEYKDAVTREFLQSNVADMTDDQKANWVVYDTEGGRFSEGKVILLMLYVGDKEVPNVTGMILSDAFNTLKAQDFSNVKATSDDGSSIWNYANWTVTNQSIGEGTVIKATDEIILTCHHNEEEKSTSQNGGSERQTEAAAESATSAESDVPSEYKSALESAEFYASFFNDSKAAIYDQLTSEYGDNVSAEAAQYAIDNVQADWNQNALKSAESYSESMHMSKAGIYDQLTSEFGEKFTAEEAQYAVDNVEADWNENALKSAKSYKEMFDMSNEEIFDQLTSEYGERFTSEQAQYAIEHLNG